MSEEFKAIRITLSEEAFERLEKIMKDASFRSYSSTIEECVRVVYAIMLDIWAVLGKKDGTTITFSDEQAAQAFKNIATRMSRITDRCVTVSTQMQDDNSTGP